MLIRAIGASLQNREVMPAHVRTGRADVPNVRSGGG